VDKQVSTSSEVSIQLIFELAGIFEKRRDDSVVTIS